MVGARAAAADPPAESACPTRDAVVGAARGLLERSHVDPASSDAHIEVRDLGERYVVLVKGHAHEYADEERDCAMRARTAAVFVALTLAPPDIPLRATSSDASAEARPATPSGAPARPATGAVPPPASTSATAVAGAPPASSPDSSSSWWPELEIGALGAVAPRTGGALLVAGPELRLVAMAARWGITLGASVPTASTIDLGFARVRQERLPLDLGARFGWRAAWLRGSFDLGLLAALLGLQQTDAPSAKSTTRVEGGVRGAASIAIDGRTFAPYLRAFAEFVPATQEIAVEPRGPIGRTPPVWIGATIGMAGKFH